MTIRLAFALATAVVIAAPAAAVTPPAMTIHLDSYAFAPAPLKLVGGRPVRLTFFNNSGRGHDFTAPAFFAAARILVGQAPHGKIDLAAGASTTIDLIPAIGRYKVRCARFTHALRGMKSEIIVE